MDDMLYEAQRKVILEIAEKEPCVMIGRNTDFILKDRDDVLKCVYTWRHAREDQTYLQVI